MYTSIHAYTYALQTYPFVLSFQCLDSIDRSTYPMFDDGGNLVPRHMDASSQSRATLTDDSHPQVYLALSTNPQSIRFSANNDLLTLRKESESRASQLTRNDLSFVLPIPGPPKKEHRSIHPSPLPLTMQLDQKKLSYNSKRIPLIPNRGIEPRPCRCWSSFEE
jgi:hypothetical protein